ncbi:hypothetical protein [Natronorubrum thiooxidans]|uniref:Lipoprotein n=1 Tax=Natronorubrum thiooxidans TaxID=308853 RepID=A0A1N7GRK5_9EURY|nr:hypothetical protein [Natronorubrum thiooxidans]SIS15186.1 hypothetical protein SAMN05421752_114113 [Natronorubrum thiooxidans]
MRQCRSRRALLTAAMPFAVAIAGCSEGQHTSKENPDDSGIVSTAAYDCADSDRPSPTLPDVEPEPYPSPPASMSDGAGQYVLEFERAYRRNAFLEAYGSETQTFDFQFRARQLDDIGSDSDQEAVLVSIVYDLTTATQGVPASTERDTRVTYYVDENVVLRARYNGLANEPAFEPDPRDAGNPVVCFE